MDRTMTEGEPIEAKMVSKAIERAQTTVEGRNAEIRKDVLKYDEVMNEQRKVVYGRRAQILEGDDIHEETREIIAQRVADVVTDAAGSEYSEEWDVELLRLTMDNLYPVSVSAEQLAGVTDIDELLTLFVDDALEGYDQKCESFPEGLVTAMAIERDVMLQIIDQKWRDHLDEMERLREGVHLRSVAQIDPLVAWKRDGFAMFEVLLGAIELDFVRFVTHIDAQALAAPAPSATGITNAADVEGSEVEPLPSAPSPFGRLSPSPAAENKKLGRNDPCYCGSGRKFKQCHGRP